MHRRSSTVVTATALVTLLGTLLAGCSVPGSDTSTAAPPWPRPTDLEHRADQAGLQDVWGERLAEHVHTHLSITDGDSPVVVPGNVGHSASEHFAAQLHTHDTSGILHVESPTRETFTLGQFFDEWGVSLGPAHVGGLRGDLTVWVDGKRFLGNPRSIALTNRREIALAVTTIGEVPHRPAPFDWPPQYR
ncbi:hypothetical protein [Curtobacterium sp. MCPF17_046]|uniref:hypothetical protein n=1 Tax=Curtobacterium sp. MCPF17_046 TaxID=2175663 RepID=UPI000D8AC5FB|nr:hypothetical protein [Curtobacterium sp. MCPF17_046]PYY43225.1 hypothetical protein DEJ32_00685 [Curtobacterium sp. MCPF17_046]